MSDAQKRSYETLYPHYCLKADEDSAFLTTDAFDPVAFFGNNKPLAIEIGFGMGRATADIAEQNPDINYLGIEVHRPGIGRLLWEIEKRNLKNLRIIEGDAVEVLKKINDSSISSFHVFFPDPWPKKRHNKRRLITRPFTDTLAAKLLPGGFLYMVSDWADYGEWALSELSGTPGLINKYSGFAEPVSWRPKTEFERKGLEKKHEIKELYFLKLPDNYSQKENKDNA